MGIGNKSALDCPHCGSGVGTNVVNTRKDKANKSIKRSRKCHACNKLYFTYEITAKDFNILNDRLDMYKEMLNILSDSHKKLKSILNSTEITFQNINDQFKSKMVK